MSVSVVLCKTGSNENHKEDLMKIKALMKHFAPAKSADGMSSLYKYKFLVVISLSKQCWVKLKLDNF